MSDIHDDVRSAMASLESGGGDGGGAEVPAVDPGPRDVAGDDGVRPESEIADGGVEAEPGPSAAETAKRARDATGKFTKAEAKAAAKEVASKPGALKAPGTGEAAAGAGTPVAGAGAPVSSAPEALKAPQSWKPAAREKWASLDPDAQQEITRRERETASAMQESAEARKAHQQFREVVAPYEGLIRAAGSEPLQMIGTLLQTGAQLRHGTPQAKADVAEAIINEYGVSIELLAAAIDRRQGGQGAGRAQGQQQAQPDPQQFRDPRIDQMIAQRARETEQRARSEIAGFGATHEFFEDVRPKMEGLLRAGLAENLEDAYAQACKIEGKVDEVLQQRKAAEAAKASQASTQRARAAASSVKTQPAGASAAPQSGDVMDDVRAAMAALSGR